LGEVLRTIRPAESRKAGNRQRSKWRTWRKHYRTASAPPEPESRQRPFTSSERRLALPFGGQGSRPANFNSTSVRSPDPFGSRLLRSALVSRPSQGVIHTRNPFSVPLPNAAELVSRPHSPSGQRPSGSKRSACHRPANPPPFPFPVPLATVPGFTERLPKGPETETAASLQGDDKLYALIRRAAGLKGSGGEKQAL